jgi:signal transduction histidine kinase
MILISGLILSAIFTIITRNYRKSIYEKTKLKLVQEKKDLEQKLIIENLENENREKTEFMSMISHELKTPLFTISGYAQILNNDQKTLNAQQKDDISEILTGINSLELIINDLLDAQKLDLKKLILEKSQINIRTLVLEVVKSLQPFFDKKSISNQIEISDDILLNCDPSRIAQILKNLLKNSVEAINHDHGLIKINVARQNDSVLFSVIDNGSGIPDTIAKNMFKKFYQIDSSLSRKKDGTGLGLYICQQLVLLHGGKIWYDSSPDKGTAFYFSIPW